MNLIPFILLMLAVPFGTSLQSIMTAICTFFLLISQRNQLRSLPSRIGTSEKRSMVLLLLVILLQMAATLFNPKNPERDIFSFFVGFIPLVGLPCMFLLARPISKPGLLRLEKVWTAVMLVWGIVVVTQHIWGWKISGAHIEVGEHYTRSQGFFSHPLTLAYVALMLWPFHVVALCIDNKRWSRYAMALGNLALLYYSASRTAQAVALLIASGYIFYYFQGRMRWLMAGGLVVALAGIFLTDNTISRRFKAMDSHQISEEKESSYADDRIAFWIVHWNMVKERPLLGHGIDLDRAYRIPYYDAIGLPGFKKAYEAHNQILQLAAEGGIGAALAFIAWLGSLFSNFRNAPPPVRHIRNLTIISLFLGGLTQNAYFDGEVRFAMMALLALVFAFGASTFLRLSIMPEEKAQA